MNNMNWIDRAFEEMGCILGGLMIVAIVMTFPWSFLALLVIYLLKDKK